MNITSSHSRSLFPRRLLILAKIAMVFMMLFTTLKDNPQVVFVASTAATVHVNVAVFDAGVFASRPN